MPNKTRDIIFSMRDLVRTIERQATCRRYVPSFEAQKNLVDKSTKCGLLSLTDGVIISLSFAVGHDFYYIWWLLKEPFIWVGVVSVA